ncbi:MAG: helix-turn-helix transcriptional regulator [Deltaproteobacteria bacterium]|nr:helix-turn-helix transcriptional regulator [Deltaproteobacteria bacterium]
MKASPKFREAMRAAGYESQNELARAACINAPVLSCILSGRMRPTDAERKRLRGVLGRDIAEFTPTHESGGSGAQEVVAA